MGEQADVELAADHRGQAQHPQGLVAETLDAAAAHVADAARQAQLVELASECPASVVAEHDPARLAKMAQELCSEERIPIGLAAQRVREPDPVIVELVTGCRRDQVDQLIVFEAGKRDPGEIGIAISARDGDVHCRRRADHMPQQLQARGICPVHVIEHHHHWRVL